MNGDKTAAIHPAGAAGRGDDLTLRLSREHPVSWLWALHRAERGSAEPCRISLVPETGTALSPETAEEELNRLERLLTDTGRARILRITADPGGLPDLDAEAVLFLPRDGLSAWAIVYPPVGKGREVTAAMLLRALAQEKVVFGLDRALLSSLSDLPNRYFRLWPIARGLAPARGEAGRVEELFPREIPPLFPDNPAEQVDYTALRRVCPVRQGAPICRLVSPGEGTPGVTVRGEMIPAQPGTPAKLLQGRNTVLSEDGCTLLAARDGHAAFTGRCFEVRVTLEIDGDVDRSTGNLNYLGDIHIRGDVRSGFTVRAMGTVQVDGVIEDTSVEAGGDLFVGQGVQGNGNAEIRAHRSVYARYLENCVVYAGRDLYSDCVIGCTLYCDGSVRVTSGRGAVIGGAVRAGEGLLANVIGARSELCTQVALGGRPWEDWQREHVLRELAEMERDQEQTARQPDGPEKQRQMADLRLKSAVSRLRLDQLERHPARDRRSSGAVPLSAGHVYPGTVISIDGVPRAVERERHAFRAALEGDQVRFWEGETHGAGTDP